ncbi:hypothetical protein H7J93_20760 [Mycobacterium barrassiae]|uniref:hypothetical protein n=1 Tax=Mycobacterium barrassiae TaxID=319709 RepID=UPI002265D58D|nr:hypothetical protein [Mycobacterium barrassiae]MCV7302062.1 hypothetical protein [Mycobacterium barrassiae]
MAEREASGDFDYLLGDLAEAPAQTAETDVVDDGAPPVPEPPDELDATPPVRDGAFDAFDSSTWYFEPARPPWYRRRQALIAWVAAGTAAAALVVSAVVLIVRAPGSGEDNTTSVDPTAPTTSASTEPPTSRQPSASPSSAPPPPPPPPEESAAPIEAPPAQTVRPQRPPRATKEPEIGVTRTPVTRSPISVAPRAR